jgi:hypothetical protein
LQKGAKGTEGGGEGIYLAVARGFRSNVEYDKLNEGAAVSELSEREGRGGREGEEREEREGRERGEKEKMGGRSRPQLTYCKGTRKGTSNT